ncbi:MAG: stage II sporulation protein P [Lachnospiraceae bacterium]|nr:stage II sporulation protein P [Lachnospiraceae bacterium]
MLVLLCIVPAAGRCDFGGKDARIMLIVRLICKEMFPDGIREVSPILGGGASERKNPGASALFFWVPVLSGDILPDCGKTEEPVKEAGRDREDADYAEQLYGFERENREAVERAGKEEGADITEEETISSGTEEGGEPQENNEEIPEKAEEAEQERDRPAFERGERQECVDESMYGGYEELVRNFYTIDPGTMAGSNQLNASAFLEKDMTLKEEGEGPQILIYHTHSQEAFSDSIAGDASMTVVGVGETLAGLLEQCGYRVLHHTGEYDKPSRNGAYARALPKIRDILSENPSIQVVIDLHRDEMPVQHRLVTEIRGKKTAKVMFFNGLSRTKQTGDLDYLHNPYLEENLAFSFQMQKKAVEYYPGFARKIYLKGYRYNMHLCPKTLLIELGAQNNTLEEAMNACGPLAHLLDLVLGGKE